jgi:hypothetical protein
VRVRIKIAAGATLVAALHLSSYAHSEGSAPDAVAQSVASAPIKYRLAQAMPSHDPIILPPVNVPEFPNPPPAGPTYEAAPSPHTEAPERPEAPPSTPAGVALEVAKAVAAHKDIPLGAADAFEALMVEITADTVAGTIVAAGITASSVVAAVGTAAWSVPTGEGPPSIGQPNVTPGTQPGAQQWVWMPGIAVVNPQGVIISIGPGGWLCLQSPCAGSPPPPVPDSRHVGQSVGIPGSNPPSQSTITGTGSPNSSSPGNSSGGGISCSGPGCAAREAVHRNLISSANETSNESQKVSKPLYLGGSGTREKLANLPTSKSEIGSNTGHNGLTVRPNAGIKSINTNTETKLNAPNIQIGSHATGTNTVRTTTPTVGTRQVQVHVPQVQVHVPQVQVHVPQVQVHVPQVQVRVPQVSVHIPGR